MPAPGALRRLPPRLHLVRDGGNPLFPFDRLDVYQNDFGATQVVDAGKLNDAVIATDSFQPSATKLV